MKDLASIEILREYHFSLNFNIFQFSPFQRNQFQDDDNINYPNFLIFVDHEAEAVVLAIRGTKDFKDVLTDLVIG